MKWFVNHRLLGRKSTSGRRYSFARKYSSALHNLTLSLVLFFVLTPIAKAQPLFPAPITRVQAGQAGAPIYKYLVHLNTGGPVACGSSLFPVYVGKRTGDTKKDVSTALRSLFATSKNSGGLYNPLADSKIKVRRVEYNPASSKTPIYLGGKLVRPKTFCDSAQARAMVWATAQQFPEVRHATIWIGNSLLGDLLSPAERAYDK